MVHWPQTEKFSIYHTKESALCPVGSEEPGKDLKNLSKEIRYIHLYAT